MNLQVCVLCLRSDVNELSRVQSNKIEKEKQTHFYLNCTTNKSFLCNNLLLKLLIMEILWTIKSLKKQQQWVQTCFLECILSNVCSSSVSCNMERSQNQRHSPGFTLLFNFCFYHFIFSALHHTQDKKMHTYTRLHLTVKQPSGPTEGEIYCNTKAFTCKVNSRWF